MREIFFVWFVYFVVLKLLATKNMARPNAGTKGFEPQSGKWNIFLSAIFLSVSFRSLWAAQWRACRAAPGGLSSAF
jgi:hypothetical protein